MKNVSDRETVPGFLRDLETRLSRQERHSHHSSGAGAGGMFISGDFNNLSMLGSDTGVYTRGVVCKATPPTVSDFGGHLVNGCVWVQTGAEGCVPWSDDFERADGAIGSNWIVAPGTQWYDFTVPLVIEDGAAVAGTDEEGNVMYWHEPQGPDQAIEIVVEDVLPPTTDRYCQLYTHISLDGYQAQFVDFQFGTPGFVTISIYPFDVEGNWDDQAFTVFPIGPEPITLRYESFAGGLENVYVNGALALTWTDPAPSVGPYVGIGLEPHGAPAVRILSASGPCLEPAALSITPMIAPTSSIMDDFERADGAIGPNWVVYEPWPGEGAVLPTISDGAAIVGTSFTSGSMRWAEDVSGVQTIEVTVSGYAQGASDAEANTSLTIHLQGNASDHAAYEITLLPQHPGTSVPTGPNGALQWTWYGIDATGSPAWYPDVEEAYDGYVLFSQPWAYTSTYVVTVEADPAGHLSLWIDGALIAETTIHAISGPKIGLTMDWRQYGSFTAQPMRIECVGPCAAVEAPGCELWAWNGSAWVLGPVSWWDGTQWLAAYATHAWDGTAWQPSVT